MLMVVQLADQNKTNNFILSLDDDINISNNYRYK